MCIPLPKIVTGLVVASVIGVSTVANAATYNIIIGAAHPNTQTFVKLFDRVFIPEVNNRLKQAGKGDTINWTTGWGGTLIKFDSLLEGVQSSVVDIAPSPVVVRPSELPLSLFTYNAPFGSPNVDVTLSITAALHDKFPQLKAQWAKFGQEPLAHYIYANHQILSKTKITSLKDLQGLKIGAAGALGNFFSNTGATPVNGNFTTYYNSLQTGVINAVAGPVPAMYQARLNEVAKYLILVNFGTQYVASITMNSAKLASLPPYIQEIIRAAAAAYQKALMEAEIRETSEAIGAMKAAGIEVIEFPAAERAQWAAALPDLAGQWADRTESAGYPARALLKSFMQMLAEKGTTPIRDWSASAAR